MSAVENPRMVLGLKVRSLRQRRGETLRVLADRSGVSVSYLSEIEKGKKYPKPERLLRIAEALEVAFDDLVSLNVADELTPLKAAFNSSLLRGFPFQMFGFQPEDLMALMTGEPERGGALLRAVAEVGRSYDVHVEHFLLAALRAYQQLRSNYFAELEQEATTFRQSMGYRPDEPIAADRLVEVLRRRWNVEVDDRRLRTSPDLSGFRSVYSSQTSPRLYVNPGLMPSQRSFVLAREIGFQQLGLVERAVSSPWLQVESFDQVFNNFKASYFAGALIMPSDQLRSDLTRLFARPLWDAADVIALMDRFGVTPETFLHRLTQILPSFFGLEEYFFLRFSVSSAAPDENIRLTKWLNTSPVPVPRGFGLSEHFCRRWPALRLLATEGPAVRSERHLVVAHRVEFVDEQVEFLEISMVRPMALQAGIVSAVTVGFVIDRRLRRLVRFWDDEKLPRLRVNLTCERCPLEACVDRVASASILDHRRLQERKLVALESLIAQ